MIMFNGKCSYETANIVVQRYPERTIAKRKYDVVSIPGRSGDLYFSQDAFENVVQEYEVYISAEREKLPAMARKAAEWLQAEPGYHELWDSYEPEIFRLAYYSGSENIENIFQRFGRMTLSFSCKPQRFLNSGKDAVSFSAPGVLHNPTAFSAKPAVTAFGTGSGTLTIGSTTISLEDISDYIVIDSDMQDAYKGTLNENAKMTGEFPELASGANIVSWTGDITGVSIIPRWWTL